MIYTAPYVMLLMRANPLRGQVGGGWAGGKRDFLGPLKWHRAVRRMAFGAQKVSIFRAWSIEIFTSICSLQLKAK